jgi:hypothetical protein
MSIIRGWFSGHWIKPALDDYFFIVHAPLPWRYIYHRAINL